MLPTKFLYGFPHCKTALCPLTVPITGPRVSGGGCIAISWFWVYVWPSAASAICSAAVSQSRLRNCLFTGTLNVTTPLGVATSVGVGVGVGLGVGGGFSMTNNGGGVGRATAIE